MVNLSYSLERLLKYQHPVCCCRARSHFSYRLNDWPRIHQHLSLGSPPGPCITGRALGLLEASCCGRKPQNASTLMREPRQSCALCSSLYLSSITLWGIKMLKVFILPSECCRLLSHLFFSSSSLLAFFLNLGNSCCSSSLAVSLSFSALLSLEKWNVVLSPVWRTS